MKKSALYISIVLLAGCAPSEEIVTPVEWLDFKIGTEAGYVSSPTAVLKAVDYRYFNIGSGVGFIQSESTGVTRFGNHNEGEVRFVIGAPSETIIVLINMIGDRTTETLEDLSKSFPVSETERLKFNIENISLDEKRMRVILYDDNASALANFPGLTFFDYDPAGVINAEFSPDPEYPPIVMDTERGTTKVFYRAGFALFSLSGEDYRMPLYSGNPDRTQITSFFTGFIDDTTGKGSYGTGRYVNSGPFEAFPPANVSIDFNYAYNPYCARSDAYNCPLITFPINTSMAYGESYRETED